MINWGHLATSCLILRSLEYAPIKHRIRLCLLPQGVIAHPQFLHYTHTHTQTGWLLTGTNALMALSYILGTLVSVGNLTHPPWAGGGWGGEGNKMGGRGLSLGCHIHLNSFPVLLLWFATGAASRLDIPVWGNNFPFFSDPESFQINDF